MITRLERKLAQVREALNPRILSRVVAEMRREHDAADGHFSTVEVEHMEALLDAINTPPSGGQQSEPRSVRADIERHGYTERTAERKQEAFDREFPPAEAPLSSGIDSLRYGELEVPPDPGEADPFVGVWRCSCCGEMCDTSPAWRWNGEVWEHKCGHLQAGHFPARYFGPRVEDAPPAGGQQPGPEPQVDQRDVIVCQCEVCRMPREREVPRVGDAPQDIDFSKLVPSPGDYDPIADPFGAAPQEGAGGEATE